MNNCNLLKFFFVWNIHDKAMSRIYSNIFGTVQLRLCDKNKRIAQFVLPLINTSVTVGLGFLLLIISAIISSNTINYFRFLFGFYLSILS